MLKKKESHLIPFACDVRRGGNGLLYVVPMFPISSSRSSRHGGVSKRSKTKASVKEEDVKEKKTETRTSCKRSKVQSILGNGSRDEENARNMHSKSVGQRDEHRTAIARGHAHGRRKKTQAGSGHINLLHRWT